MLIRDLDISARAKSCLLNAGYNEIEEILEMSNEELLNVHKNMNDNCVLNVREVIDNYKSQAVENTCLLSAQKSNNDIQEKGINELEEIDQTACVLYDDLDEWDLSVRTRNCLRRAGINYVQDLCIKKRSDMRKVRNLGRKSFEELCKVMKQHKVYFADVVFDENGEAIEWLYDLSDEIVEVVKNKPEYWEYYLYMKTVLYVSENANEMYSDMELPKWNHTGFLTQLLENTRAVYEYCHDKILKMIECIPNEITDELKEALGAPGEAGDAEKIIAVSKEIGALYKKLLQWQDGMKYVYADRRYHSCLDEIYIYGENIKKNYNELFSKMKTGISFLDKYNAGLIPEEAIEIDLSQNFNNDPSDVLESIRNLVVSLNSEEDCIVEEPELLTDETEEFYLEDDCIEDDDFLKYLKIDLSLDNTNFDFDAMVRLANAVFGEEIDTPDDFAESVIEVLSTLTEREQKVLIMRFGLNGCESYTLEEAGKYFGVSRERVRQIEAKSLRKLRHPSRARRIKEGIKKIHEEEIQSNEMRDEEKPIEILELGIRSYNCLKRAHVNSVEQLCAKTCDEILRIRNLGRKSFEEVLLKLHCLGFHLRDTYIDDEKNEIVWLRGYPNNIAEIALNKGNYWEYMLLVYAIQYECEKIEDLYQQQKNISIGIYAEDNNLSIGQIVDLVKEKLNEIQNVASSGLGKKLRQALGYEGRSGDAELIIDVASEMVSIYKKVFEWRLSFQFVGCSKELVPVMQALVGASNKLGDNFKDFSNQMLNNIKLIENHDEMDDKISLEFNPDFDFDFDEFNIAQKEFFNDYF